MIYWAGQASPGLSSAAAAEIDARTKNKKWKNKIQTEQTFGPACLTDFFGAIEFCYTLLLDTAGARNASDSDDHWIGFKFASLPLG